MRKLHDPNDWVRPREPKRRKVWSRREAGRTVLLDEAILLKHIAGGATTAAAAAQVPMSVKGAQNALANMRGRFGVDDNHQLLEQPEVIEALQNKEKQ